MNPGLFIVGIISIGLGFIWVTLFPKKKVFGQVGINNFVIKGGIAFVLIIGGLALMAYSFMF